MPGGRVAAPGGAEDVDPVPYASVEVAGRAGSGVSNSVASPPLAWHSRMEKSAPGEAVVEKIRVKHEGSCGGLRWDTG